MPTTDLSEKGLETLIVEAMTGKPASGKVAGGGLASPEAPYGGTGWILGDPKDYDRDHAVDLVQLSAFLQASYPEGTASLDLGTAGPTLAKFLARLQGEVAKRGVVDVLRKGIRHGPLDLDLFHGTPTPGNQKAAERHALNRFSVVRQLRYSPDATKRALDLCLFVNGLPVITFELKNLLTKQSVEDAVHQYQQDRDPHELLFQLGRCVAHFAVDDREARFCTELKGKESWFLPFNQGFNDGAGNPPNPDGVQTDYLWKRILTPAGLTDILEHYAAMVEVKDPKTGKKKRSQIFPRYHQLDVVRRLLSDAAQMGVGRRYLIQHSAGSGKSNSIAWLAHQLIGLQNGDPPVFDSTLVVTDRRILDQQIRDTVKQFAQVGSTVGHADHSGDLKSFIAAGKKIIITTLQKFPYVLDEIGSEHRDRRFAILIDEAHSSQGGRTSAMMSMALSIAGQEEEDETTEDVINRIIEAKKLLPNASYFAFTATPKEKTLELFGEATTEGGEVKHRPFHSYTMKQAIQEKFILDVLKHYTPVHSYYKLTKKVEADPAFDKARVLKKLRKYVEGNEDAIRLKAEIMVDHFHQQVLALGKIGGQARAMVVTGGIERAIRYFQAFQDYLPKRNSPFRAIVAFSGEFALNHDPANKVTEAMLNGFPSSEIPDRFQEDPFRFLICADKFQTGYDEPLLHTMYVDKVLEGIKAVQTLSRLNRAHPKKHDVFVLDFVNAAETIQAAFQRHYRTTILSGETDPNKLHDLLDELAKADLYSMEQVDAIVAAYLGGASRETLDPKLKAFVPVYKQLSQDEQVRFKGTAKAFVRTYGFLSCILPFPVPLWERMSIFLNLLIPNLPAPEEDDLSKGVLELIDMDSYRVEKKTAMSIQLVDEDAEVGPGGVGSGGGKPEPEIDLLSSILQRFNDQFGSINWTDADRVKKLIATEIPAKVAADQAYQNAREHSDAQNARIEHDKALQRVMTAILADDTELFRQFSDNDSFRRWMTDTVFQLTYR